MLQPSNALGWWWIQSSKAEDGSGPQLLVGSPCPDLRTLRLRQVMR